MDEKELPAQKIQQEREDPPTTDQEKGQGVSAEEIQLWKDAAKRFDIYGYRNDEKLDLFKFPRPQKVKDFFEGEENTSYKDKKLNPVNNPLRLIRPATLHSVNSFIDKSIGYGYPRYYEDDISKRGQGDTDKEINYLKTVQAFESVATAVLESLNEGDPEKRRETVKNALDAVFNSKQKDNYHVPFEIQKASPAENPQGWLVYSVLSVLEHPSEEITPVGRLRALELLAIYPAQELAERFRSEKHKNEYGNGYDQVHTPRLPHTFCSRDERLQQSHEDIWASNPRIRALLVKDSSGKVIDWRATATAIISKNPEEAVQVALLLMHGRDTTGGALIILRSIPKLDRETLSRMFNNKATFLIEHKLAAGKKLEDLIAEGTGITEGVIDILKNEELTRDDLLQQLRREKRRVSDLEEDLVRAEALIAKLKWEKMQADALNTRQAEELDYWRAGQRTPKVEDETGTDVIDRLDPKGYYRILGLHPALFEGLREEAIQKLITKHYHVFAATYHPDVGGETEKMKLINEAYKILNNVEKRRKYGLNE